VSDKYEKAIGNQRAEINKERGLIDLGSDPESYGEYTSCI